MSSFYTLSIPNEKNGNAYLRIEDLNHLNLLEAFCKMAHKMEILVPEMTNQEVLQCFVQILRYLNNRAKNHDQISKAYGWAIENLEAAMARLLNDVHRTPQSHMEAMTMIHKEIVLPSLASRLPEGLEEPHIEKDQFDGLFDLAHFFKSSEVLTYLAERKIDRL